MKKNTHFFTVFLLLFAISSVFGQKYYDDQWKKIAENYKTGKFKSNLPIILKIQKQAMKDDNANQLIRSLKAEFSIVKQTRDDEKNDSSTQFFTKLSTFGNQLKGEQKLMYEVLLGEFFSDFYNQNQWEINQRTNLNNQDFVQIETWSKLDFKNYLTKHFADLEKKKTDLQNIQLSKYKAIFEGESDFEYFPTLFDWNAVNQTEFLENEDFFTPNERKENYSKINQIYDELIAKNSNNSKLYFQHLKINYNCEFSNCKDKFQQLEKLVKNNSEKSDYKVLIIDEMIDVLQNKEDYKTALVWINEAKKMHPKSNFINNIVNKENGIKNPYLVIFYEKETQNGKPIQIVAEGKNVKKFSINIYEVKDDFKNFIKYVSDSYKNPFSSVKKSLVRKENYELQNPLDFKIHKTALEIKPLPSGIYLAEYIVENSDKQQFYFVVSDSKIVYMNRKSNGEDVMRMANNETGRVFPNTKLNVYEYVRGKEVPINSVTTDENGAFRFPKTQNTDYYRNFLLNIDGTNNYILYNKNGNVSYPKTSGATYLKKAQIYLDRKIYRPGQIVYFKVINTKIIDKKETVANGESQEISLYDANGEKISSQKFTTNDFGSYNGNFVLPKGNLNGRFSLRIQGKSLYENENFQVEEYKRPKFEVEFDPIKDEYKYGQTIVLKGKAAMFSGVPLSNSTVNYEIKKQNIRWRYFWWFPRTDDNENSILGTVTTNEKGEFAIKIDLQKDETLEGIQIDNYAVNASVTDINGETQSAETNIKVASVSHYIKANEIGNVFSDEAVKLNVDTKNYNDQNLNKPYQIKLLKLEEPKQVFRDNFVSKIQDLPQLSKEEFTKKFPHDKFDKNDEEKNWKVEKEIFHRTENPSTDNGQRLTNLGSLNTGTYKLELYNIEGKDTIKNEQFFKVWDKKSLGNQNPFLEVLPSKTEYKRGEKALVYIYSAVPDAFVTIFIQDGKKTTKTFAKTVKTGILQYEIEIPNDQDVNNINVQFQLLAYNDVQTKTINLKIEDTKKPLKIETVTFRDKLQPGQKEKWTVKITDASMTAEVLAGMYDKSLDQFAPNNWIFQQFTFPKFLTNYNIDSQLLQQYYNKRYEYLRTYGVQIPQFNWFDGRVLDSALYGSVSEYQIQNESIKSMKIQGLAPPSVSAKMETSDSAIEMEETSNPVITLDAEKIHVRENLNETAFFYPNLLTDKDGNVSFEFTSPEALTAWKVMFLAHNKNAESAVLEKEVVTQKEFSVTPNYPRFLREGDELNLQTKLSNLTNKKLNGFAQLQILDAFTNEDISEKFGINQLNAASGYNIQQAFSLNENGNSALTWKIKVPNNVSSIILKVVAKAGQYSDGEQKAIPVLPNRMLVTNAIPVFVKEGETKTFVLENLAQNTSTTATNFSNTLELTTNPIWEIMFALPSLKNDQNNSADVVFNKWFADVLAAEIFKANPKLKTVFDEYQSKGLLTSNLEKNQELKQLLLEETPWVLESKNEEEQMRKLVRLFDVNTMRNSINTDWDELKKLQNPDGGFSWYQGYPSSYYNSLYILKNLGKINEWLKGNVADYQSSEQKEMVSKLVNYVDSEVYKYWDVKKEYIWNNYVLDYLDIRNYWEKDYPMKGKGATLKTLVKQKAKSAKITDFTFFGLHRAALLFENYGLKDVSQKLMTYLKETSTESKTQGVYWKQNLNDWGWYSSKTVNHAGALEAFNKLTPNDTKMIEEMKIWLITQKEVDSWGSSRGTAEVIFTILNSGKSWTSNESDKATIIWGGKELVNPDTKATGYVKSTVKSESINKNLGTVTVAKPGAGIVQGGLFWQYYEDLDKIKSSESYISITKELYKKIKTVNGEELIKINENSPLKVGDKVTVRMILNTDRNMEFIHLKDMRAAGFEPLNVISNYQWKNNLGYYQSTKDASTNFYIQYMPKGKYVFEYDYICNASGTFSNGITTLQNYYAPQMNAHTKGTRVKISE